MKSDGGESGSSMEEGATFRGGSVKLRDAGTENVILRCESSLVRWEDGLALFRVRLSRVDGVVVEAHGAAHDGEAEQFWTLAEDRARSRAIDLLSLVSAVDAAGTAAPDVVGGLSGEVEAAAPQGRPPAPEVPAAHTPPAPDAIKGRQQGSVKQPETNGPSARVPHRTPAPTVPQITSNQRAKAATAVAEDPFSDEVSFVADGSGAEEEFGDAASPPALSKNNITSQSGTPPEGSPLTAREPHIRGETGGASPAAEEPPAKPAAGTPVTAIRRCSHPGCNLPLTQGQMTVSQHKFGQALCARHMRERGS